MCIMLMIVLHTLDHVQTEPKIQEEQVQAVDQTNLT
jgi:hypothetical protein